MLCCWTMGVRISGRALFSVALTESTNLPKEYDRMYCLNQLRTPLWASLTEQPDRDLMDAD